MAAFNWGREALILGSFIMFATGVFANWDSSAKASIFLCSCFKKEGKLAMIRPAKEISFSSTSIPAWPANAFIIGSREYVANAGASSVFVYVQGSPVDIGGYYLPDEEKASYAMRPCTTFNNILSSLEETKQLVSN